MQNQTLPAIVYRMLQENVQLILYSRLETVLLYDHFMWSNSHAAPSNQHYCFKDFSYKRKTHKKYKSCLSVCTINYLKSFVHFWGMLLQIFWIIIEFCVAQCDNMLMGLKNPVFRVTSFMNEPQPVAMTNGQIMVIFHKISLNCGVVKRSLHQFIMIASDVMIYGINANNCREYHYWFQCYVMPLVELNYWVQKGERHMNLCQRYSTYKLISMLIIVIITCHTRNKNCWATTYGNAI